MSPSHEPKIAWFAEKRLVRNAWRDQFKWIIWALRLCLRFPYSTDSEGHYEIKYKSFAFIHWIVVYTIYVALTLETLGEILNRILTENMNVVRVMIYGYNISVAIYIFTFLGCLAKEFKNLAYSINRWPEFEEMCRKRLDMPVKLKNQMFCKVGAVIILPGSVLVVYSFSGVLVIVHSIYYIVKVMIVASVNYMLFYWVVTVKELSGVGEMIKMRISEDLCSLDENSIDASKIRDLRTIWLELIHMIKLNVNSWSYTFTYLALTLCIVIIMMSFASISILVNENRIDFGLLVIPMTAAAIAYWMLEYSHRLTQKTGCEINESLGNINMLHMDGPAKEEAKLFCKVVKMNYPSISLGGVLVANRAAMTSMLSSIVTNLVVILQLSKDMSLDGKPFNATSNFTNLT